MAIGIGFHLLKAGLTMQLRFVKLLHAAFAYVIGALVIRQIAGFFQRD